MALGRTGLRSSPSWLQLDTTWPEMSLLNWTAMSRAHAPHLVDDFVAGLEDAQSFLEPAAHCGGMGGNVVPDNVVHHREGSGAC